MEYNKSIFEKNLTCLNGDVIRLDSFSGKPLIVHFWATWCGPCHGFNSLLSKIYESHADKINIVSISLDGIKDPREEVAATIDMDAYRAKQSELQPVIKSRLLERIEQDKLNWPNHICTYMNWGCPIAKEFEVRSIPKIYLYDKNMDLVTHDKKELLSHLATITK